MDKISSCPCFSARPENAIDRDTVRNSEENNIVCVAKAERNVLVDVIRSGKAGKL